MKISYHPVAQDWLLSLISPWMGDSWEELLLEEVFVRPVGGAHPVVYVGPNAPV